MSLSIIIPTLGRESLSVVLSQICPQLYSEDEVIVVADGVINRAREIAKKFPVRYFEYGPTHNWGSAQRNYGMKKARKSHLYFFDDDDEIRCNTLKIIRDAIELKPDVIHIFRIYVQSLTPNYIWTKPVICRENISTQMFVIPNDSYLGTWPDKYEGDRSFLSECLHKRGENLVAWHTNRIATVTWNTEDHRQVR